MLDFQFKYHFINEVDSTNSYFKTLSASHGLVVYANFQTKGRGTANNYWESQPEKNLLCSILLEFDSMEITNQVFINMALSIAVHQVITKFCKKDCFIKWPNDIIIDNKKISGILIENSIQGSHLKQSIIGIGININQENFETEHAISIKNIINDTLKIEDVLNELCLQIKLIYSELILNQFDAIAEKYNQLLYRKNQNCFFILNEEKICGEILNVNNKGMLELMLHGQIRQFAFKEISMVL